MSREGDLEEGVFCKNPSGRDFNHLELALLPLSLVEVSWEGCSCPCLLGCTGWGREREIICWGSCSSSASLFRGRMGRGMVVWERLWGGEGEGGERGDSPLSGLAFPPLLPYSGAEWEG